MPTISIPASLRLNELIEISCKANVGRDEGNMAKSFVSLQVMFEVSVFLNKYILTVLYPYVFIPVLEKSNIIYYIIRDLSQCYS